jgi:hypothetical protein
MRKDGIDADLIEFRVKPDDRKLVLGMQGARADDESRIRLVGSNRIQGSDRNIQ